MTDSDEYVVTRTVEVPTAAMTTIDARDPTNVEIEELRDRIAVQKDAIRLVISLTSPHQWTVFSGRGKDGQKRESVYPSGAAADTILRRGLGFTWSDKRVEVSGDGKGMTATATGMLTKNGVAVEEFTGHRAMGGYIKNEADLRKGAIENMKSVAVRDLLGLRGRTPEELAELGLNIANLPARAEFQNHAKQGSELVAPFGRQKGAPLPELTDENLDWLTGVVRGNVQDPSKSKYREANQNLLSACEEEMSKRGVAPPPGEESAPADPHDEVGPPPWEDGEERY